MQRNGAPLSTQSASTHPAPRPAQTLLNLTQRAAMLEAEKTVLASALQAQAAEREQAAADGDAAEQVGWGPATLGHPCMGSCGCQAAGTG